MRERECLLVLAGVERGFDMPVKAELPHYVEVNLQSFELCE